MQLTRLVSAAILRLERRLILTVIAAKPIERRDEHGNIVIFDASIAEPTEEAKVVVWADEDGLAMNTATETVKMYPLSMASMMQSPSPTPEPTTTTTMTMKLTTTMVIAPADESAPASKSAPVDLEPIETTTPAEATPVPTGSAVLPDDPSELFGVSYAPYRANHECKSQDEIDNDFSRFASQYGLVRIYGTDCNQVPMVYKAAKAHGMKVFLGIWNPSALQAEVNNIIAGINGDWAMVHTVSVGNELVNNNQATAQHKVSAGLSARSMLRAAGYAGPVVTVDTFMAVQAHPELCEQSDYCAFNAHAFFDSTIAAHQAGSWLANTVNSVRSALSVPKKMVVTESGWPTLGASNGLAVPGLENQKLALDSIKTTFASNPGEVILFSAFNDLWKTKTMATFDADQYWGIDGAVSNSDM